MKKQSPPKDVGHMSASAEHRRRGSQPATISLPLTAGRTRRRAKSIFVSNSSCSLFTGDQILDKLNVELDNRVVYDMYEVTGDFEKDFVLLCGLVDVEVDIAHRVRLLNHTRGKDV